MKIIQTLFCIAFVIIKALFYVVVINLWDFHLFHAFFSSLDIVYIYIYFHVLKLKRVMMSVEKFKDQTWACLCKTCYVQHLEGIPLSVNPFRTHGFPDLSIWHIATIGCVGIDVKNVPRPVAIISNACLPPTCVWDTARNVA